MSADKKCCVPCCGKTRSDNVILHTFPNPDAQAERFRNWIYAIGGDILALDNQKINKNRRVCHDHFEPKFYTTSKRLTANSVVVQTTGPNYPKEVKYLQEMEPISQKKVILNNGVEMPLVGFGTFRIRSAEVIMSVVESALAAGYRLFDTAAVYGNEKYIGDALRILLPKFGLTRRDVFITTKLSPRDAHTKEIIKEACRKSVASLGVENVDLYLIHFPGMANLSSADTQNIKLRAQAWEALVECYKEGLARAIGVSNYTVRHLQELALCNSGVVPAVNQVECHPYFPQRELLQYCQGTGIALQAYCSLGGTSSGMANILQEPVVMNAAQQLGVSSGQLLLAWATQQGIAVIPKSTHADRIKENISLNFKIPEEHMKALDNLGVKNTKYAWDPSTVA